MTSQPLSPKWHQFIKRVSGEARKKMVRRRDDGKTCPATVNNVLVLKVTLFLDVHGMPIGWTDPKTAKLEPGNYDWVDLIECS